jgi:hypothetical protein
MRRVEILILSWAPDAKWLHYSLESIRRYLTGVSHVTVVYPRADDDVLGPICEFSEVLAVPHNEPPPPHGHLAQNLTKCYADEICPEATHIMHVDSDCVFTSPTSTDEFFLDDKPILVSRPWDQAGDANVWREPTGRALGWDPASETMAAMPIVYDARLYGRVREHVSNLNRLPFDDYVMGCRPTFPYGFCEHNTLGSFALERAPELCSPVFRTWPALKNVRQLWSHDGLRPDMEAWLQDVVVGGGTDRPPPDPGPMTEERRKLLGLDGSF